MSNGHDKLKNPPRSGPRLADRWAMKILVAVDGVDLYLAADAGTTKSRDEALAFPSGRAAVRHCEDLGISKFRVRYSFPDPQFDFFLTLHGDRAWLDQAINPPRREVSN